MPKYTFGERFTVLDMAEGRPIAENLTMDEAAERLIALSGVKRGDSMYDPLKERANYRSLGIPELEDHSIWVVPHGEAAFLDMSDGDVSRDVHIDIDSRYALYKKVMTGLKVKGARDVQILPRGVWADEAVVKTERWSSAAWDDKDTFLGAPNRYLFHNRQECADYLIERLEDLPESERFEGGPCGVEYLGIPGLVKAGIRAAGSEGAHYTCDRGGEHDIYSRVCRYFGREPKDLVTWSLDMDWGYVPELKASTKPVDLKSAADDFDKAVTGTGTPGNRLGERAFLAHVSLDKHDIAPSGPVSLGIDPYDLDVFREHMLDRGDAARHLLSGIADYSPEAVPEGEALQTAVHGEDWGQGPLPVSWFDLIAYHTAIQEDFERGLSVALAGTDCYRNCDFTKERFREWFDKTLSGEAGGIALSKGGMVGAFRDGSDGASGLAAMEGILNDTVQATSGVVERECEAAMGRSAPVCHIGGRPVYTDDFAMAYVAYASSMRAMEREMAVRTFGIDNAEVNMRDKAAIPRIRFDPSRPDLTSACQAIKLAAKTSAPVDTALFRTGREALDRGSVFLQAPRRTTRSVRDIEAAVDRVEQSGRPEGPEGPGY